MDQKKVSLEEMLESIISEMHEELKKEKQIKEEMEDDTEEVKPIGPMPFEQALGVVKKAYTHLGKEYVFWTDDETSEEGVRKIYFFTYVKDSPIALCAFMENDPKDLWFTDIAGGLLTSDWYVEELED